MDEPAQIQLGRLLWAGPLAVTLSVVAVLLIRTVAALPTLEDIFSQLAVEQDTVAISRQIADLILA